MLGGKLRREDARRSMIQSLRSDQLWTNSIILEDRGESWRIRRQELEKKREQDKVQQQLQVLSVL
jgi:hypothetical protein